MLESAMVSPTVLCLFIRRGQALRVVDVGIVVGFFILLTMVDVDVEIMVVALASTVVVAKISNARNARNSSMRVTVGLVNVCCILKKESDWIIFILLGFLIQ